jgi:hypothetical protein
MLYKLVWTAPSALTVSPAIAAIVMAVCAANVIGLAADFITIVASHELGSTANVIAFDAAIGERRVCG